MDSNSISQTFSQRTIDEDQAELFRLCNLRFSQIEELINRLPKSRLASLALTEIEKASLVVNKAISRKNDA